jgi:hypothetical protein
MVPRRSPGKSPGYDPVTSAVRHSRGSRSIGALLVVRLLLVGNGVALLAIGALYLTYGSRPGGAIVGGVLISASLALFACVPLTNPYRTRRRR